MHNKKSAQSPGGGQPDQPPGPESWQEVGRQLQALGRSLADTFQTAWKSEENRRQLKDMQKGLESMASQISQAIEQAAASTEGRQVRQQAEKAASAAQAAGKQALQDAQPHLLAALRQINSELQKLVARLQQPGAADEEKK
jgi:uncharacterized phage infection (PIP) family protein YhgE